MSLDIREVDTSLIAEYRATSGQLSGLMEGQPVLLLTTTGRPEATIPVVALEERNRRRD